jgi:hypothetical protein
MVIGAAHLSVLRGFHELNMDPKSIQQKGRALRLLNDGIGNISEKTCMDILFGILSLASAEVRYLTFFHSYVFFVVIFALPSSLEFLSTIVRRLFLPLLDVFNRRIFLFLWLHMS